MKKICMLLLPFALGAAEISQINTHNMRQLSAKQAAQLGGLMPGAALSEALLDAALKRLYATGYFKDIKIVANGGAVDIYAEEKPFVAKVSIKGSASNDKRALEQVITLRKGQSLDDTKLRKSVDAIVGYYEAKGFYDSTVSYEVQPLGENAVKVEFFVNRGERVVIKKMHLIGAKKVKYSDISPVVANKERELLGWMWGFDDGKLRANELPKDSERIKDVYFQRGYLDASISAPYLLANMQNHTAELSYTINEGQRYKVDSVEINGLPEEVKFDQKKLKTKKKKYINSAKIRQDVQELTTAVQDKGYARVQVFPRYEKLENNTVKVIFDVTPGEVYKIAQVIIEGNDKSADKIVRRELYLTEGKTFSATDLADSIIALRKTGYFSDVQIIPEYSFMPNELNLRVKVAERMTGSISGGLGYSSADGILLNASVRDRNLLGSGLDASVSVEKSKKDLTGRISLKNPRLFDSRYSLGGSVYSYSHEWGDYEELNRGVELTLGREIGRHTAAGVSYTIEQSDLRKATLKMVLSGEKLGKRIKSAASPYLIYDSTDDYYLPRKGIYARAAYTYAGLGGDVRYKRLSSEFKWFYGLKEDFDTDLIFRFKLAANKIFNYQNTPINNRLYLGGLGSVRGFDSNSISPKGEAYYLTGLAVSGSEIANVQKITKEQFDAFMKDHANDTPLEQLLARAGVYEYERGGSLSTNASMEMSFPISDKLGLRGSLFYDIGYIGASKINEIKRSSYGVSLDWTTPMGPLTFVFARPIDDKPGDKVSRFEFSIGSNF